MGISFLYVVCKEGYIDIVNILFRNKVDVNFGSECGYRFILIVC